MALCVIGTDSSTRAAWYMALEPSTTKDGIGKYHRFMLSTDDASIGFSWNTTDQDFACEDAPVTTLDSVLWEKTGVQENIVSTENTRGYNVSKYLEGLTDKALLGQTVNEDYQTWVIYSRKGGKGGEAFACLCTIQMNTESATAGEKSHHEFDLLPVGKPIKVQITADSVGETDNEVTVTASAAGE